MSEKDRERTGEPRRQAFISHRQDYDKAIADVLRGCLRTVSARGVHVFRSSYAGAGPCPGDIPHQYGP